MRLGPTLREGADPAEMAVRMRITPYKENAPEEVQQSKARPLTGFCGGAILFPSYEGRAQRMRWAQNGLVLLRITPYKENAPEEVRQKSQDGNDLKVGAEGEPAPTISITSLKIFLCRLYHIFPSKARPLTGFCGGAILFPSYALWAARRSASPETPVQPVAPVRAADGEESQPVRLGPTLREGVGSGRIRPYRRTRPDTSAPRRSGTCLPPRRPERPPRLSSYRSRWHPDSSAEWRVWFPARRSPVPERPGGGEREAGTGDSCPLGRAALRFS